MKTASRCVGISMMLLLAQACGVDDTTPKPVQRDLGGSVTYQDGWALPPAADLAVAPAADTTVAPPASDAQPVSCPNLVGTWKGTIEGKANTYLQNVQMTGTVTMTVAAGATPTEFQMTGLDVEAWSPLLPMFKVPLKTIGSHAFQCGDLKIASPIEAQGKKGAGTITGQCTATQCTGAFEGKTDDGTMDAQGKFTLTRQP